MKQRPPSELAEALARYREVLERYAGTLDLMSDAGFRRLDEHLEDALAYVRVVASLSPAPRRVLDVGSGAGLPGIVIAAALPDVDVELVERRRKRVTFLSLAVASVDAPRARVRSGDVRRLAGPPVDVVTAQAVGHLELIHALTSHRHASPVHVLSRKGPDWPGEVEALESRLDGPVDVVAEVPLAHRGTLLAIRVPGGTACRSSA